MKRLNRNLKQIWRHFLTASAVIFAGAWLYGMSYGFTCPGSTVIDGCPMGGIGGGNFNFLPGGTYNFTWIRVKCDAGVPPLCIAFQKRGGTVFSGNLVNGGAVSTTFTGYWPTVFEKYTAEGMLDELELECFSPIIAGDGIENCNKNSSLPIAIYKFTIKNTGTVSDTAAIALSNKANEDVIKNGNNVVGIKSAAICIMVDTTKSDPADVISCGGAAADFSADGKLDNSAAGVLAKRVVVGAGKTRAIYFCVAWTGVNGYYRKYFTEVDKLAAYGIDNAASLEAKVDNWHNKILNSNLADWFKDLAINCLHAWNCMTDWVPPNTYGMQESMSSGLYGTNDQAYHAHFGLACFAPDAAWSQVQRMTSSQYGAGLFAHLYGETGNANLRSDVAQKFVMETLKDYQWTGNTENFKALYPNIKRVISGIRGTDSNGDGLSDDNATTTYDNPGWDGWTPAPKEYDNELFLSAIKGAIKGAVINGTPADTTDYSTYFNQASTSFEKAAGAGGFYNTTVTSASGKTGYYQACLNSGAAHGTCVWNSEFMGQWLADVAGCGPLHPESRIQSGLNIAYDACLDKRDPPCYDLMMANADVNCSGATPTGTFYNPGYVEYATYGPGEFCAAFNHNLPDISMRALHAYWNVGYKKIVRPYNAPCKLNLAGVGVDWGTDRYMNVPACFAGLIGITGFSIDVNAKELRLKPSLPTSAQYKMDSLAAAPIFNPLSLGTVDYKVNSTATPPVQRYVVKFDNPMQFTTFYAKKLYAQKVNIMKPAVNGTAVTAAIAPNSADTSEYKITFGSALTIDNTGVLIIIGDGQTGTMNTGLSIVNAVDLTFDVKRGAISYILPQRMKVDLALVDVHGVSMMRHEAVESAGLHVMFPKWKNMAAGIYYANFKAGDAAGVKKLVLMR